MACHPSLRFAATGVIVANRSKDASESLVDGRVFMTRWSVSGLPSESLAILYRIAMIGGMTKQITPEKRRALAAQVGVHEQYLYQCLTGRRDMNPAEARRIEDATRGEVSRRMLCQKTWEGIWPELAKPARKAKTTQA